MVATSTTTGQRQSAKADGDALSPDAPAREGGLRRLLSSVVRVVDIQYRIWLTQAKVTLQRMMIYAALFAAAALLGLPCRSSFSISAPFHLLTDVAGFGPVWAWLDLRGISFDRGGGAGDGGDIDARQKSDDGVSR